MADCGPQREGEGILAYDRRMQECEGGSDIPADVYQRFVNGTATESDLVLLVTANEITPGQAQEYANSNALGGLENDLAGLAPLDPDPANQVPYYLRDPNQSPSATVFHDPYGELYDRKGGEVSEAQRKRILGSYGGSAGISDPYAGAANARAERALAEQVRAQRIREVESAQDAIQARMQAAQQARLEGAKFSVTPSMQAGGGYFPGLQPNSPLVTSGLAQPFQYQAQAFNPERGTQINEQRVAADLAMIRRVAGQGG